MSVINLDYKDIVYYDNGKLFWKIKPSPRSHKNIGDEAGDFDGKYWRVRYKNTKQRRHRIVYFLHTGKWPPLIDHINRDKLDDRVENLREGDYELNSHNSVFNRGKVSFRGVHLHTNGRYRSQFHFNKKRVELGLFDTAEEASEAYQKCKQVYTSHIL